MSNKEKTTETPASETQKPQEPTISEILIQTLTETYEPAITPGPNVEMLTTMDLIEEMAAIADVEKWEVVAALQKSGFITHYSDAGFHWLLKRKPNELVT